MDKLISVAIPVYNRETTLRKCVDSILARTYENIEVILVNDGSTDRSEDTAAAMSKPIQESPSSARQTEAFPRRAMPE